MFDIHGELDMSLDKNIILVALTGPFNDMGVEHWAKEVKAQIEQFADRPFFILMDNTNYGGFTAEASAISNKFNLWLNEQPMVAKAIVQPSALARKMNQKSIPALANQNIEYFEDKSAALAWLKTFPEYLDYLAP